ncbi:hypothetical protein J2857_001449 [Neorhizobium galegae]|uniref:hypothetical protein n=1 Tax=Neorhizobium galegae TaxID=399 RepID=UPI001AE58500|nr:hypothetical protein [Neorhizobium galegae]MBP2558698.1 hypothetical protein [Neorhizobium galegae]
MQVGDRIGRRHSRFHTTEPFFSITSAALQFTSPHTIRDKGAGLGAFDVGNKIGIKGGPNNARILTIKNKNPSELLVDETVADSSDEVVTVINFS